MAKGRKLTISRSERYLYGYNNSQVAAAESPELREDDVWPTNNDDQNIYDEWAPRHESNVVHVSSRGTTASGRLAGGLSLAFDDDSGRVATSRRIVHRGTDSPRGGGRHMATSAPVNVPNWSDIYRADSGESLHDSDDNDYEMVPPHEYLAREYRKMNTTSVLEGVGRTLKGRDLSRVRDAVWSQTGFDG